MNAYDLCQRHVVTVRRFEELATAAWTMRERNVGCLVVVDPAGGQGGWRPVGLLTDRDIVVNVFARDRDPHDVTVEDVMNRHPLTLWAGTSIEESLQRLRASAGRRAPVVDERGCLAGILALDDIFDHLAQRAPFAATSIRPDTRPEPRLERRRALPAQPGMMGIDRI